MHTCICHNHSNGTALSLSVAEDNALAHRNHTKYITKENKNGTYVIIIKLAYITEVFSHIDSTAYAHL
jgi:hypothetical protein